ncbi:hypothetical protein FisN_22Lh056 [Fistulifera solaris]|uniref:CS domain-containing protein n=1 Tax=Fistulifera solaris TaxID=1519565 RepID=A0A1Z5JBK3_FISSO|nr:hypothetical protein FisN_22Lh056 [Fistulifera solaris]|eukprot:GAX11383.1 hypothetical protein FisN_22Lh056 [Fistulifera solaris]
MSRIDYSKWDHLEDSDDDYNNNDDNDNDNASTAENHRPRVTKLEQPSRITTQADGTLLVEPSSPTTTNKQPVIMNHYQPVTTEDEIPSEWIIKGDHVILENNIIELWWSQDRYSVTIRIRLASEMKIKSVQIEPILSYQDRHCATGTQTPVLKIHTSDGSVWFEGSLSHPVHLAENDDDDTVDWTIVTHQHQKYLTMILYKATPMAGMFVWWKRPLLQCPERSLETDDDNDSNNDSRRAFQQAWTEAHQQFVAETSRPRNAL